jgi:crossover junction endodeoxyribonuclease RuvC
MVGEQVFAGGRDDGARDDRLGVVTLYAARPPVRVLGVDPGLTRCGLGVVDGVPGRPPRLVAVDVIRTGADEDIAARLLAVESQIERWLDEYRPDTVAVERVFSQHNVRTVMGTAQAGAVAIVCAARRGLPVALHTPSEVKAAVTGSGRAGKDQVATMVARLLRLTDPPRPADAADALALAICHLWRVPAIQARQNSQASQASQAPRPAGGTVTTVNAPREAEA